MSSEVDPETQEKQNYLRTNIMEAGYDTNTFVEFLIAKKGEAGQDVANWSLPDLKNVVQEFISLHKQENNNNNINNNKDEEKKEDLNLNNNEKKEPIISQSNKEENLFGVKSIPFMECLKVSNNELSKCDNIQITVGSFEKVEGGLFSKSYVSYLVTTQPLNWNVRRRFSDFEWLRQTLINHYNYCLIPSVPKKPKNLNKIVNDKFDKEFLSKRSRNFEKFLNYLIIDPILKNIQLIYDFLSLEKDDEFQKMKKTYDKLKQNAFNINKVLSLDGNAIIEINEYKEQYFTNIKESTSQNENILKKINTTIKGLKEDMYNACNKLTEISQNFNLIKENAIQYTENDDVIQSYAEMSVMFENLSVYLNNQNDIIFINLKEYFKYVKNNYRSMKDFIHKTENLKNAFYKSYKNLKIKKEDLFKKGEIYKWDLDPKDNIDKSTLQGDKNLAMEKMLYKETAQVNSQKIIYGFYLNRIIDEHDRIKTINSKYHYDNSMKIFEMMTNKTTEFITSLADNTTELINSQSHQIDKNENKNENENDGENEGNK